MDLVKLGGLPPAILATELETLKTKMKTLEGCKEATELLQTDNVTHHFEQGVYGREIRLPKGTIVISRVHKTGSINVISQGHVIIIDTDGRRELKAPVTFPSSVGTHRVVIALEDTVWTGVHHTDETNPDNLFESLTCETYDEFTKYLECKDVGSNSSDSS